MKIREAIEKASAVRGEQPGSFRPAAAEAATVDAPSYSETRAVTLNPEILRANRCLLPGSVENSNYKVLRTQILKKTKPLGHNAIMVTSPTPGNGKTLTAINLAINFARDFSQTVLLMDCDLIRQSVHRYLGVENDVSLADYLVSGTELKDLMIWPGIDKFTFISGSHTLADSTEYLSSPRMRSLVQEVKQRYPERYIFFDVPPVLAGAEAMTFAPLVDGIIMVVEAGRTTRAEIRKALDLLPPEKFLGFILNKATEQADSICYYY
ncbi:MAG: Tyrosine-protein kinase YwqD [Deltaproteobacteria bacterium ADurb.Bin510]|nr:MAG: Tyrosine-protein kinase YwqD [Deltaproteobacteria bacterium ADurb.Bin510]